MPYPVRESAESLNRTQIFKVYIVAGLMALIAGYINSAMLIEFSIPVSQMSGVASQVSAHLVAFDWSLLSIAMLILISFILGAFISGLLIGQQPYNETPNYGYGLILNCVLLTLAALFSFQHSVFSVLLSAMACGIQNALVASYRGLQLRTTHMTGNATDIGVHFAKKIMSKTPWNWQSNVLVVLLVHYVLGGIIGIYAYLAIPNWSLIFPGLLTGILGSIYLRNYSRKTARKARQP
jgi:uncharacterized membrane protein YoaK (UPF0700 family)